MTETEQAETDETQPETYVEMFDEFVRSITKVSPSDKPLIFHARKICAQLDAQIEDSGSTLAAKDGAYLQAIERLNKRLTNAPGPHDPEGGKGVEGQQGLFGYDED